MKSKVYLFILLILINSALLIATETVGDAGREIALLEIGYGAKALALGSAYVAYSADASSVHWNPAALAKIKKNELATMQNKLASDADYYYIGAAIPTSLANFGLSWLQVELAEIPETAVSLNSQNEVEILNNLTYQENAITLGIGRQITKTLALGINAKYISKVISHDLGEGKGYSSAVGLLWQPVELFAFGLLADNIKNEQRYDTKTTETVPVKYTAGFLLKASEHLNILAAAEKKDEEKSPTKGHGGLEILVNKNISFYLGYNYDRVTVGAGFRLASLYVDYAYIAENSYNLGAENFVTLGVKW